MADEMLHLRITPNEDRQLNEVAPAYLRGPKKMEQRVRWAIDQFLRLLAEGSPSVRADSIPVPGPNPKE